MSGILVFRDGALSTPAVFMESIKKKQTEQRRAYQAAEERLIEGWLAGQDRDQENGEPIELSVNIEQFTPDCFEQGSHYGLTLRQIISCGTSDHLRAFLRRYQNNYAAQGFQCTTFLEQPGVMALFGQPSDIRGLPATTMSSQEFQEIVKECHVEHAGTSIEELDLYVRSARKALEKTHPFYVENRLRRLQYEIQLDAKEQLDLAAYIRDEELSAYEREDLIERLRQLSEVELANRKNEQERLLKIRKNYYPADGEGKSCHFYNALRAYRRKHDLLSSLVHLADVLRSLHAIGEARSKYMEITINKGYLQARALNTLELAKACLEGPDVGNMGAVIDSHCDGLQRLQESGNLSYIAVLAPGYGKKGLVTCGVLGLGALAGGSALVYLAAFGYIASTGPLGLVFMGVAIVLGVIALALFVGAMRYFKAPFSGDRWGRNAESAEKEVIAAASSYKLHVERGTKEKETWGDLWHRKVHCIKAAWASIHITASIGECFGKTWRKLGTEWTTSFHGLRTIGQSKTEGNPKPTCALVLRRRHAAVAASGGAHAGVVGEHMLHLPPPSSRCGSPDSYLDCEEAA